MKTTLTTAMVLALSAMEPNTMVSATELAATAPLEALSAAA